MAIPFCLAMTAHELANCKNIPTLVGYLSCHFSPSGFGLSNMPKQLPPGSVLILDDSIPIADHRPELIRQQLDETITSQQIQALVLDLQRPGDPTAKEMVNYLAEALPCPVIVTPEYASPTTPVLLPPCPVDLPLKKHIAPYKNPMLWLELALDGLKLQITKKGCAKEALCGELSENYPHRDDALFCRYHIAKTPDKITFTVTRTQEDTQKLLEEAGRLGISHAIGLYQEWK